SAEFRMQLDFVVRDAALRKFLPAGWEPNVATQAAAKDCNLRMIFIERNDVTDASGAAIASDRLVYLAAPVKQSGSATTGQMIIAGLTTAPKYVPGPFANYQLAAHHRMERSLVSAADSRPLMQEQWEFAADSGERMSVSLKYERAPARRGTNEIKFFSPTDPTVYQIFKID